MAKILLAGCGKLGMDLGPRLQQQGHEVIGLRRSQIPMPFACLQGDLLNPHLNQILPANIDYVIYTATPSQRDDNGYANAYPRGVNNLLQALHGQPIKRFIFVSSTAVYHQDSGEWVDESSPTQPTTFNGRRLLEAETQLNQHHIASTSVRFGGIYGGERNRLWQRIKTGITVQQSPPKYTNRIHHQDCVNLLAFLIDADEQGRTLDACYVGVDDDPADECTVYHWLADFLNAPKPIITAPNPVASQNKRCRNQRVKQIGFQFLYPSFREGAMSSKNNA